MVCIPTACKPHVARAPGSAAGTHSLEAALRGVKVLDSMVSAVTLIHKARLGVRAPRLPRLARLALLALICAGLIPANAAAFKAGAARADITPPPYTTASDAAFVPICGTSAAQVAELWPGPRPFAFEKPYRDIYGLGRYAPGDPYCDADHTGRYEAPYIAGGSGQNHWPTAVEAGNGPAARAIVFAVGGKRVAIVAVDSIGLFNVTMDRIRAAVAHADPSLTQIYISSTHDESAPDPIGLWGPDASELPEHPETPTAVSSGVDEYYFNFLVERVSWRRARRRSRAAARDARRGRRLDARQHAELLVLLPVHRRPVDAGHAGPRLGRKRDLHTRRREHACGDAGLLRCALVHRNPLSRLAGSDARRPGSALARQRRRRARRHGRKRRDADRVRTREHAGPARARLGPWRARQPRRVLERLPRALLGQARRKRRRIHLRLRQDAWPTPWPRPSKAGARSRRAR